LGWDRDWKSYGKVLEEVMVGRNNNTGKVMETMIESYWNHKQKSGERSAVKIIWSMWLKVLMGM
jgi:hypothetical protein